MPGAGILGFHLHIKKEEAPKWPALLGFYGRVHPALRNRRKSSAPSASGPGRAPFSFLSLSDLLLDLLRDPDIFPGLHELDQVLEQMLDRDLMAEVPEITPAQAEEAMVSAIQALGAVVGLEAQPLLEEIADGDPSLKVRRAAHAVLESLGV